MVRSQEKGIPQISKTIDCLLLRDNLQKANVETFHGSNYSLYTKNEVLLGNKWYFYLNKITKYNLKNNY